MQQSVELITHFAADFKREAKGLEYPTEYAMLGKLSGFIAAADPKIAIYTDEAIEFGTRRVRIDLMLKKGDKSIIVELKRPSTEWTRRVREGIEQVKGYLAVAGSTEGIVFVPPRDDQATIEVSVRTYEEDNVVFHIAIIAPGMLHNKGQPTS
jgi:hypothetical protein